jgi:hypothetical protein
MPFSYSTILGLVFRTYILIKFYMALKVKQAPKGRKVPLEPRALEEKQVLLEQLAQKVLKEKRELKENKGRQVLRVKQVLREIQGLRVKQDNRVQLVFKAYRV